MKVGRCPICHYDLHLDAIFADDAGREVFTILSKLTHGCGRSLVEYIGLFRPIKSNLSNSRTAGLMNDVLALYKPSARLNYALQETVKRIREKRAQGDSKPLTNHNYLKTVYDSAKQLFAYTETKEEVKPHRDSNEAFFEQSYRLGADFSKIQVTGAQEWYAKRKEQDNARRQL